jgi:hypothetical protein
VTYAACTCRREHVGIGEHVAACPRAADTLWRVRSSWRPVSWWPQHDLVAAVTPQAAVFAARALYRGGEPIRDITCTRGGWSKIRSVYSFVYDVDGRTVQVEQAR